MKVEGKDGREMRIEGGIEIELERGRVERSTTFTKQNHIHTYKHMLTVVLKSYTSLVSKNCTKDGDTFSTPTDNHLQT